jgi:hypothetical protein
MKLGFSVCRKDNRQCPGARIGIEAEFGRKEAAGERERRRKGRVNLISNRILYSSPNSRHSDSKITRIDYCGKKTSTKNKFEESRRKRDLSMTFPIRQTRFELVSSPYPTEWEGDRINHYPTGVLYQPYPEREYV